MIVGLSLALLPLVALLSLVGYVHRLHTESGRFLSLEFSENIEVYEQRIAPRLGGEALRPSLAFALLEHLCTAAIAFILACLFFLDGDLGAGSLAGKCLTLVVVLLVFNRALPFVLFSRTRGEWLAPMTPLLRLLVLLMLPLTAPLGFVQSVVALTSDHNADEQPEHPSEAVDALIEAGQDEGILEEEDRELIHSVVEFGDKVVREVMTPRPKLVAVPASMSIEELTRQLGEHPYSRLPVYSGSIDQIVGIVYARDVLQVADVEAAAKTVGGLMRPEVYFVPETKSASKLLGEMQQRNLRMSVVVDEYGRTAGLVTTEDLVEEIVGELRDERESEAEATADGDGYLVDGSLNVDRLEELFAMAPLDCSASTVGGLVIETAGHIPLPGEQASVAGLRFEVLSSTSRRVERLRVTRAASESQDSIETTGSSPTENA